MPEINNNNAASAKRSFPPRFSEGKKKSFVITEGLRKLPRKRNFFLWKKSRAFISKRKKAEINNNNACDQVVFKTNVHSYYLKILLCLLQRVTKLRFVTREF